MNQLANSDLISTMSTDADQLGSACKSGNQT